MPVNPSPEYKNAEAEYRKAREPLDRLHWLREMLRTIPKHKGTEHLQADIKGRIKELTDETAGPKKGGARTGPAQTVRPEGAAQVALIGPPNAGKSTLHARLTGSHAEAGPYPFTTKTPLPGMLPYLDVHFQLVDLPPVSTDYMEAWMPNALQPADAALLVVDLADPECPDHVLAIRERLDAKRVSLVERWPGAAVVGAAAAVNATAAAADQVAGVSHASSATSSRPNAPAPGAAEGEDDGGDQLEDPFRIHLPTLLLANKSDLDPAPDEVDVLEELIGVRFPALAVSAKSGAGLDRIGPFLFEGLGVVRVYTKAPGRPADKDRPYTLRRGGTVLDVARLVHRELAESVKFARVWGSGVFDGQQVGRDHRLADGDVIELHA